MVQRMAHIFSGLLCKSGAIEPDRMRIYAYGLELMLASLASILSMLALSAIFFRPSSALWYLISFIPLRSSAGGYHAKSHWACNLVCLTIFTILHIFPMYIPFGHMAALYILASIFSFFAVLLFSPCEAVNKPLTLERRQRNRRISLLISGGNLLLSFLAFWMIGPHSWLTSYYLGVFASALSIGAAKIWNKKE